MATITPLSEGTFTIGMDKIFYPFDPETDDLKSRVQGSLIVEIQPFLVQTKNDKILLDTGLGFHLLSGSLQIHDNLRKIGIQPEEITKVVLSHLHKDHAGGISYINKYGQRELTFPQAEYYIYKPEFDYALAHNGNSYLADEFRFLADTVHAKFYSDENGILFPGCYHEWSGGHCPHHQVIFIEEDGQKIFYGGDEAPQIKQLKFRYVAKYDFDGKKACDLREEYVNRGRQDNWELLFYHDIATPTSKIDW